MPLPMPCPTFLSPFRKPALQEVPPTVQRTGEDGSAEGDGPVPGEVQTSPSPRLRQLGAVEPRHGNPVIQDGRLAEFLRDVDEQGLAGLPVVPQGPQDKPPEPLLDPREKENDSGVLKALLRTTIGHKVDRLFLTPLVLARDALSGGQKTREMPPQGPDPDVIGERTHEPTDAPAFVSKVDRLGGEEGEPPLQAGEQIDGLAAARSSDDDKEPVPRGLMERASVQVVDAVFFFPQKAGEAVRT